MRSAGATNGSWGAAAFAGAWCTVFLAGAEPAALGAVPLVVVGVLVLPRTPVTGALLTATATLVSTLAGTRYGSVDTVAGTFLALVAVGRRVPSVAGGLLLVLANALASSLRGSLGAGTLAVTLGVYGAIWAFGRVVRARTLAAEDAVAEAERLAATDPVRASELLAAEERRWLANEALSALRQAVIDMGAAARTAQQRPGRPEIALIRVRGEAAITELRELLGLLRDPAGPADDDTEGTSRRWPLDLMWVLVLCLIALPAMVASGPVAAPELWALYLGIGVAVAVRRRLPVLGCLVAAAATVPVALSPPANSDSLLPAAMGYALLSWSVALGSRRVLWWPWALLALVAVGAARAYGSDGVGFILAVFAFPYLTAVAWDERDAILRRAAGRRDVLREEIDRAAESAIDAARLRLARELHDVVGHAVGVMVLQAGAAEALLDSSPDRSRQALSVVVGAGEEAVAEIAVILAVLDESEHDASRSVTGSVAGSPRELREALTALVERLGGAGMRIHLELGELPAEPESAVTVFRVVQEGLTNAARHAPGSTVTVTVRRDGDDYLARVRDDAGAAVSATTGGGYGLRGLRERVVVCGGSFEAGRRSTGGFAVEARLPVTGR